MAVREKAKKVDKWIKKLETKLGAKNFPDEPRELDQFIHYLIFYANNAQHAKKAIRNLQNEHEYGGWNEIRVATVNEIAKSLDPTKIKHTAWLSRIIKHFLEGVWRIQNEMTFDKLRELKLTKAKDMINTIEDKAKQVMYGEHEERRGEIPVLSVIPPWAATYIITSLGIDSNVPWDPHTERVGERLKLFDPSLNLVRRKKQLRALAGDSKGALQLHHLLVEHGKKYCTEEDPKCSKCPVSDECEYFKKSKSKASKKKTSKSTK